MEMPAEPFLLILGLAIGCLGTLIGAGGGFLLVPILFFIHPEWSVETITATSLAVVFANATSGSFAYAKMKRIDFAAGRAFVLASIPGVVVGALATQIIPRRPFGLVFGILLVVLAVTVFRLAKTIKGDDHEVMPAKLSKPMTYLITAGIGLLSSLLGIGGGIIHVPFLVHVLGFPVHRATATSHFVLAFMAGIGTAIHIYSGAFAPSWQETLLLAFGVMMGAQVGAKLSPKVKGPWITRGLASALIFVGLRLFWQSFGKP